MILCFRWQLGGEFVRARAHFGYRIPDTTVPDTAVWIPPYRIPRYDVSEVSIIKHDIVCVSVLPIYPEWDGVCKKVTAARQIVCLEKIPYRRRAVSGIRLIRKFLRAR